MSKWVLDSSAVLVLVNGERGAERVTEALLQEAVINAVNFGEVVSKLSERGVEETAIRGMLDALGFAVEPLTKELAYDAGLLRRSTRRLGLSFGDRVCLALAKNLGVPVMTTDRSWTSAVEGAAVQQLR